MSDSLERFEGLSKSSMPVRRTPPSISCLRCWTKVGDVSKRNGSNGVGVDAGGAGDCNSARDDDAAASGTG